MVPMDFSWSLDFWVIAGYCLSEVEKVFLITRKVLFMYDAVWLSGESYGVAAGNFGMVLELLSTWEGQRTEDLMVPDESSAGGE